MKKLMILGCLMLMSTGAFAQRMFVKPMVGATLSTLTGDVYDTKMRLGLGAGAEFGYMFSERFGGTAGLLFSMQSCKFKFPKIDDWDYDVSKEQHSFTVNYLNIPILVNYYLLPGFAIKAGVQPGYLLSANTKYTYKGNDRSSSETDGYNKFALSIPIGLSYEISDFIIDARYHFSLTNVAKSNVIEKYKFGVIMVTVGYKIPL